MAAEGSLNSELQLAEEWIKSLINALSGSLGGFASSTVLFPLDLVKTKLQSGQGWNEISDIVSKSEYGYLVLWKHGHVRGVQSSIEKFLYFYNFEMLMQMYTRNGTKPSTAGTLLIGYISDAITASLSFPVDNVVNRSIKQNQHWYTVAKELAFAKDSFSLFYAGFRARLVAGIKPAIQFTIYEKLRPLLLAKTQGNTLTFSQSFLLGAFCRAIADIIMYPARVVKVRQQGIQENKTLGTILKNEGIGALYKGLSLEVGRGVLSAGMMLMIKEQVYNLVAVFILRLFRNKEQRC